MQLIKIVILGGGFGGIYACKKLLRHKYKTKLDLDITLIDQNNYFLFTPLLHEVASGNLSPEQISIPIRNLFKSCDFTFYQMHVDKINPNLNEVICGENIFKYDYLVVATGSGAIHNTAKNNYSLKTLNDAKLIKNSLIQKYEELNHVHQTEKYHKSIVNLNIIGSGPTGVELACEIAEFRDTLSRYYKHINRDDVHITLFSSTSKIIENYPTKSQDEASRYLEKLGIKVLHDHMATTYDEKYLYTNKGSRHEITFNYWTTGIQPNTNFTDLVSTDSRNNIITNEYLQTSYENIFAIGDITSKYSSDAQTAVQQSKVVADNIISCITNKPLKPYIYKQMGILISLGRKNATGEILGVHIKGRAGWFIWRTIYLTKIPTLRKRLIVAVNWTLNLFSDRDISKI